MAATNSPFTLGMHHCCFRHGWRMFFSAADAPSRGTATPPTPTPPPGRPATAGSSGHGPRAHRCTPARSDSLRPRRGQHTRTGCRACRLVRAPAGTCIAARHVRGLVASSVSSIVNTVQYRRQWGAAPIRMLPLWDNLTSFWSRMRTSTDWDKASCRIFHGCYRIRNRAPERVKSLLLRRRLLYRRLRMMKAWITQPASSHRCIGNQRSHFRVASWLTEDIYERVAGSGRGQL